MAVHTHRQIGKSEQWEFGRYSCFLCGKSAHYWSQDENKNGTRNGPVVWHCQAHRNAGRRQARRNSR